MAELTVYPEAGEGGGNVSTDTWLYIADHVDTGGGWGERNVSAADQDAGNDITFGMIQEWTEDVSLSCNRMVMTFDTSELGAGAEVTAATLSVYKNSGDTQNWHISGFTPADYATIGVGDYDQVGSTSFGSKSSWSANGAYGDFSLNASGLANIDPVGVSGFSMRTDKDMNNVAPAGYTETTFTSADASFQTTDPKLVITYTPGSDPAAFFHFF